MQGFEAVKKCEFVFLEHYTAILGVSKERLEKFYDKKILLADRETVEERAEVILKVIDHMLRASLFLFCSRSPSFPAPMKSFPNDE